VQKSGKENNKILKTLLLLFVAGLILYRFAWAFSGNYLLEVVFAGIVLIVFLVAVVVTRRNRKNDSSHKLE